MNKWFALFVLLGVAVWLGFAWKLAVRGHLVSMPELGSSEVHADAASTSNTMQSGIPLPTRNPFVPPAKIFPVHIASATATKVQQTPRDTTPPPYRLDAVLPGENPVAIIRYGQQTMLVKPGQKAWEAEVISVGKDEVTIRYREQTRVLKR